MSSILTNNSAMVALQTLKSINMDLAETQNAISTGKDINSAKDNSAIWAISKVMESDVVGFESVQDSLAIGQSTVAVASAGAERIVETLKEMKALAIAGQSETADFAKINADLQEKIGEITAVKAGTQFNGVNLLIDDIDGDGATSLTVISSLNRVGNAAPTVASIDVNTVDFTSNLDETSITAITDSTDAATAFGEIEAFLTVAINGAASLGAEAARIENQQGYISKLNDAVKSGIGSLVDADMEAASAKLQALQTQQQLGVQALSIANQAPQTLLSLFR
ncbi:flagellin [Sulfitobacter albidus]|uniref:Flagellin n=1 Tax=Sulfitobacter albidus TaxID=2829501 RepID=A0A975JDJ5_9RHOB|nr:flagellin [Sulfitobacter albidus]QUJ76285.1 flagellin [Sulfitobacter albidus]